MRLRAVRVAVPLLLVAVSGCSTGISEDEYEDALNRAATAEASLEALADEHDQTLARLAEVDAEREALEVELDTATNGTLYQGLDLSSPENAVATFAESFHRRDFVALFLIMDRPAQTRISTDIAFFEFGRIIAVEDATDPRLQDSVLITDLSAGEHLPETFHWFEDLMTVAATHSAFLIDLSGQVRIDAVDESTFGLDTASGYFGPVVDVRTTVEGIDGDVIFRTTESRSGRWRVHQVIVPGGNERRIPWAASGI